MSSSCRPVSRKPVTLRSVEKLVRSKVSVTPRNFNDRDYYASEVADRMRKDASSRKLLADAGFDVRRVSEKRVDTLLAEVQKRLIAAWVGAPY